VNYLNHCQCILACISIYICSGVFCVSILSDEKKPFVLLILLELLTITV